MRSWEYYDEDFFRRNGFACCIDCDKPFRYIACLLKHQKKHHDREVELRENRDSQ